MVLLTTSKSFFSYTFFLTFEYNSCSDSRHIIFFISSEFGSSLLKNIALLPFSRTLAKRLIKTVVLPWPGRPPTIVISPLVNPPANLSILLYPVLISLFSLFFISFKVSLITSSISCAFDGFEWSSSPYIE